MQYSYDNTGVYFAYFVVTVLSCYLIPLTWIYVQQVKRTLPWSWLFVSSSILTLVFFVLVFRMDPAQSHDVVHFDQGPNLVRRPTGKNGTTKTGTETNLVQSQNQ